MSRAQLKGDILNVSNRSFPPKNKQTNTNNNKPKLKTQIKLKTKKDV